MNGQMWRMTTNNKEEQMQAQKEKHNVKQENWQGDWHNLQNSDFRKLTVLIQVLGSRTTRKVEVTESQGILPWDGAQT